jgi:hypothetical protein
MNSKVQSIKSYKIVYPQVYSYILPERVVNDSSQKIGYTENENIDKKILQQVKTAAFSEKYTKLWSAPAFFDGGKESFIDKTFHKFLIKKELKENLN